jgi:primosomal protein N' (replication factor Y)
MFAVVAPVLRLPGTLPDTFDYVIPETLAPFVQRGSLVAIPWRKQVVTGVVFAVSETSEIPEAKRKAIVGLGALAPLPGWFLDTIAWAAQDSATHLSIFLHAFVPDIPKRAILREVTPEDATALTVTRAEVSASVSKIPSGIADGRIVSGFAEHLELILSVVQKNCSEGFSVLCITPHRRELDALAEQLAMAQAFPVVVLGHDVSAGKRYRRFVEGLTLGSPVVFVGTRSAVMHPGANIAEVIVLETESRDHRNFDGAPHYDARSLAKKRAEFSRLPLLMASACPRSEDAELFPAESEVVLELPTLVDVGIVKRDLQAGVLSEYAVDALTNALQGGRTVLLLHNRKGASLGLFCKSCREAVRCSRCRAVLVPRGAQLRCPRCTTLASATAPCVRCGNLLFGEFGHGTRRIAAALSELFPDARVVVTDSDNVIEPVDPEKPVVSTDADIMVGTALALHDVLQLPHLLPRLGVIISTTIDASLAEADFRAAERAWQEIRLLQYMARTHNAELIVQTIQPDHTFFAQLSAGVLVARDERGQRAARGYPPYGRLITLTSRKGPIPCAAVNSCRTYTKTRGIPMIGPMVSSRGIHHIILKTPQLTPELIAFLRGLPEAVRVDTDPDVSS